MVLPKDPNMLLSIVNMKLRDGDYDSLSDLCLTLGIDENELVARLGDAGFKYDPALRQFR